MVIRRVQFELTPGGLKQLNTLRARNGYPDNAETIRTALVLYDHMIEGRLTYRDGESLVPVQSISELSKFSPIYRFPASPFRDIIGKPSELTLDFSDEAVARLDYFAQQGDFRSSGEVLTEAMGLMYLIGELQDNGMVFQKGSDMLPELRPKTLH